MENLGFLVMNKKERIISMEEQLASLGGLWEPKSIGNSNGRNGIRILCDDGIGYNTRIIDNKTGKLIGGLTSLSMKADANGDGIQEADTRDV
jgi:hypothetical protein